MWNYRTKASGLVVITSVVLTVFGAWIAHLPTARALTYFSDSFEPTPVPGWLESDNGAGTSWDWGTLTVGPRICQSPPFCYGANMTGDYTNDAIADLVTPSIDLTAATNAWLHFGIWYSTEGGYDYVWVSISTDGGGSWTDLGSFTGAISSWRSVDYDITTYVGTTVLIRFRLETDFMITYPGVYVDDVAVDDIPPPSDTMTITPVDRAPSSAYQGDVDVLMAALDASVDNNTVTLASVRIDLTGTGGDADIAGVILWADDGDNMFDPFWDFWIGSSTFFGSTTTIFTSWDVSAGVDQRFFLTYDISGTATAGAFVGAGIVDATYFNVTAPDAAACLGCPFDTYVPAVKTEILAATVDTMTMTPVDLAPNGVYPGDTYVPMAALDASVDNNTASLESLRIDLTGTGSDTDVSFTMLWADNGDLVFVPIIDSVVGFGMFIGGQATFTLFSPLTVTAGNDQRFFISYSISGTATVGAFVGVGIVDATYFTVTAPDVVTCAGCPFDTHVPAVKTEILIPPVDTMTISPVSLSPATAQQAQSDVLMAALDASVDNNTAIMQSVRIDLTGTGGDADIDLVQLWLDDGDLVFDPPSDFAVGSGTLTGGTTTLPTFWTVTAGNDQRFFLTYDIALGATIGAFIGAGIADATYFNVTAPDQVACAGCPFDTYVPATRTEITAATIDTLTFTPFDMAPATTQRGDYVLMGGINLTVDANTASVAEVRIDLTGLPPADSDISIVALLLDDGDGRYELVGDSLVGLNWFTGGTTSIPASGLSVTAPNEETLWIVYVIDPTASVGDFVGVGIAGATYVTVDPPDLVSCSGCPFNSYVPSTKTEIVPQTTDTLTFSPVDYSPTTVQPGDTEVLMLAVDLSVDANTAAVHAVTINLTGQPPLDSDVTGVRIWLDDGDQVFEPADDLSGPMNAFVGHSVTFPVGFPVSAGSPMRFWITFDISPTAVIGDFIGTGMTDATYVTASPPDLVSCNGCPFNSYVPGTKTEIVAPVPDVLTVTPLNRAPTLVQQGNTNALFAELHLSVDNGQVALDSFDLDLTGTGSDSDIAAVDVRRDDGDGIFEPTTDVLIDTGGFTGGTATFTTGTTVVAGTDVTLWVSADIAVGATIGAFVGMAIADATYFTISAGDTVTCSGCPFNTYVVGTKTEIIGAGVDILNVALTDLAPASVVPGTSNVSIARMVLSAAPGSVTLVQVDVNLTGTGTEADVAAVSVWQDDGDGTFNAATDTKLVTGTFVSGASSLTLNLPVPSVGSEVLFLAYDIASGATAGHYVGAGLGITSFVVNAPDMVTCASCPFDTYVPATKTLIAPTTGTIDGIVVDQDNNPLAGVTVELVLGTNVIDTKVTNATGQVRFTNVTANTYTVRASLTGYQGAQTTVVLAPGGTQTANLQLMEIRGSITGLVRDGESHDFIQGAQVQLLDSSGGLVATATTDANGRFTFSDLDMDTYSIQVTAQGPAGGFTYEPRTLSGVQLAFADPSEDVGIIDLTRVQPAQFPTLMVGLVIAVVAVTVILALLLMRRRKKPEESLPPGTPLAPQPPPPPMQQGAPPQQGPQQPPQQWPPQPPPQQGTP